MQQIYFDGRPITAYGTHVLVKRMAKKKEKSIHLVDDSGTKSIYCRLVSKGAGRHHQKGFFEPATLAEPGDLVVVRQFEGRKQPLYRMHGLPQNSGIPGVHIVGREAEVKESVKSEYTIAEGKTVEAIYQAGVPWPHVPNSKNSFKMLLDYVIIKRDPPATKRGRIHIPELSQEDKYTGVLIAAGPGYHFHEDGKWIETEYEVGERVVFSRFCGYETVIDGVTYMSSRAWDLYCISNYAFG